MNPDESALLLSVRADPSDPLPQLLYADWLEERGCRCRADCLRAEVAAAILGAGNVLGILDVERHFRRPYSEHELRALATVPFSDETLRQYKDTHVLIAGAPLSVNEMRKLADSIFCPGDWYNREAFATTKKVGARWYLLRKEPVPESRNKTYDEQTALLKDEEVPFACEVTYLVVLYWLTHRERLLPHVFVRCQDKESDGFRVDIGGFGDLGFFLGCYPDSDCENRLGLASSVPPRKS